MFRLPLALAAILLLAAPPSATAAWRAPVAGKVVARVAVGPDPYAAGQRRGIDLAAAAGARVRSPCRGRVAFAGPLPRSGAAVAIRCGSLTATVLGLASTAVEPGMRVAAGAPRGVVGAARIVRLGARRTARRLGYLDPLTLLGGDADRIPTPAVGPSRRRQRAPRPKPSPLPKPFPRPTPLPRPVPELEPAASGRRVPAPAARAAADRPRLAPPPIAWVGLALMAAALPVGAVRAHERRVRARRIVPALARR
jgi:hypothetical protein